MATPKEKRINLGTSGENFISINEEVLILLLSKLEVFEEKKEYLESNLTLPHLSKKLNTNTTYLSKTINSNKGKSFVIYINHLRIDHIIILLKTESLYRKYTIKALGELAGFNSAQQFSDAFHEKTGIRPSSYLDNMVKNF